MPDIVLHNTHSVQIGLFSQKPTLNGSEMVISAISVAAGHTIALTIRNIFFTVSQTIVFMYISSKFTDRSAVTSALLHGLLLY